ncbi:MAG: shikimate dehydrogenase [Gammaproteobacteria bacterium]|nr:shikimate dehydrogenase [Gammaproteobacteria bacterium]MCP4090180.1 shikimate dehydrogenase [Gammaproteobacteria bacterium]MCP4277951.1 shikimate dehydrogenase [Gammaproteobacteria bacterium]MCP4832546.1 shikimate dehydrogenase [Gammaproteobacteria bacterium]MCP4928672.1 shikimate dehydrogenase [Gammaproteobacteria bacterium]
MAKPDRYAVIGHPIAHSKSPIIHQLFAQQTGEAISYEAIDVPADELAEMISEFMAEDGCGLNVTVPHKQNALVLMDTLTDRAKLAGAVNTITRGDDDKLQGDNTDGIGLIADLRENLNVELIDSSILILGAGGATRGIVPPLMEQKPAELIIANRTVDKAQALSNAFVDLGNIDACGFDNLNNRQFHLIINATSAGLEGELPPFPSSMLSPDTVCYDLSYSMRDTPFISWAKQHGCKQAYQGWGMLVEQAAESFAIWRGLRPETAEVRARLP